MNRKTNPIARDLASGKFKQRIVRPRKGRGSYKRKRKNA